MDDGDDSWQRQLAGTIAVGEDAKPKAIKKVRSRLNSTSSKSSSKSNSLSNSQPDSPFKTPAVPTFNQDSKTNSTTQKQVNTTVKRSKQIPKHDYEATMLLGEANRLYANKKYTEASKACFELIRRHPEVVQPYRILLKVLEALGNFKEQLELMIYIAGLEKDKDPNDYLEISELAHNLGDDRALEFYNRAQSYAQERKLKAQQLRQQGGSSAETEFDMDYDFTSVEAQAYQSRLYMERGEYQKAIDVIHPLNFSTTENQDITIWISHIYSKFKDDKEMAKKISLDMYQRTGNGHTMSSKNIYQVAYALYETGAYFGILLKANMYFSSGKLKNMY